MPRWWSAVIFSDPASVSGMACSAAALSASTLTCDGLLFSRSARTSRTLRGGAGAVAEAGA